MAIDIDGGFPLFVIQKPLGRFRNFQETIGWSSLVIP